MVKTGRFQKFDHGSAKKNIEAYDEPAPPEIDISRIKVPTAMFMPQNDILGNIKDSKEIISRLQKDIIIHCQILKGHGHFLFSHGNFSFFDEVIKVINQVSIDF